MVRNRIKKTEKGNFSEECMREAVLLVEQGMSIRKAAMEKRVKYPTLFRYVQKKKNAGAMEIVRMKPHYDCRKIFTSEQEKDLANYIIICSKMYYGLTSKDCRRLAYEMAETNSISCPITWKNNKLAGIDWFWGFMKRNPKLSFRSPEACSLSRATSFNRTNVNLFFDNLDQVLTANVQFSDGTRIFNLDETATTTVQKSQKVLAEKGSKQVSKCTSAERGTTVTTCCIVSATGNAIPPAMIFPRVHFKPHMIKDAPAGTLGLATASGWMTSELFVQVMKHFIHHTNSSKESPTLLLFDNHDSHLSIEVIDLARENGVTIVTFPPHCTHKLQPLDVGVYKAFKTYYNAAIDSWMMQHPGQTITIYEVAGIVKIAHQRGLLPENIMSGFRKSGIFPFDRHIFRDEDFLSSYVTDRPDPNATNSTPEINQVLAGEDAVNRCDIMLENVGPISEKSNSAEKRTSENSIPSTSNCYRSPEQFKGYPKASARKKQTARKKYSIIATSTPEKNILAEKTKNSTLKAPKKTLFKKNKHVSEKECRETDMILMDSDNDDEALEELREALNPENFDDLQRAPLQGDFVLVQFEIAGKKDIFYIGEVMCSKDDNNDYEISFLRKSNKMCDKFVKPALEDRASVQENHIRMILPKPTLTGTTKRQNSYLSFGVEFSLLNMN